MSKIKDKVIDDLNKKVESEADEFKKKYPEIAKMTVAEVVATNLFTVGLRQAITSYRIVNCYAFQRIVNCYAFQRIVNCYAFQSLKRNNTLEPENFRKEYIACMDKESNMPYAKRVIVLDIGNDAYRRTVKQMMKNYDAIQSGEAVENLDKLSL